MMKQITIKFIEHYPPYMKGETAGFFERQANRLIDRGFAIYEGGDGVRETAADRLKALRNAPQTRHIAGPTEASRTSAPVQNAPTIETKDKTPLKVEGDDKNGPHVGGPTIRKCGICSKPGHTRANCPKK